MNQLSKFKVVVFCVIFFSGFLVWQNVFAADYYVCDTSVCGQTPAAPYNSWSTAADQISEAEATLTSAGRAAGGDIIWVADGTYGAVTVTVAENGDRRITIKKSTEADHGTETGYVSTHHNGQAIVDGYVYFQTTGYVTWDGNRTAHPTPNYTIGADKTGVGTYGFYIRPTGAVDYGMFLRYGPDYVRIYDTEIDMSESTLCLTGGSNKCVQGSGGPTYAILSNLKVSTYGDAISTIGNNSIIEHTVFQRKNGSIRGQGECGDCCTYDNGDGVYCTSDGNVYVSGTNTCNADHGDAIVMSPDNMEVRYNTFNWVGQNVWYSGGYAYSNHKIHGNLFYQTSTYDQSHVASMAAWKCDGAVTGITNIYFYNNTVDNYYYVIAGTSSSIPITNFVLKNNIFTRIKTLPSGSVYSHTYNASDVNYGEGATWQQITTGIYADINNEDYRLAAGTIAGDSTIGSAYSLDKAGVSRNIDGIWDRGAYEYSGASLPTDTTPPTSPTGLAVN